LLSSLPEHAADRRVTTVIPSPPNLNALFISCPRYNSSLLPTELRYQVQTAGHDRVRFAAELRAFGGPQSTL